MRARAGRHCADRVRDHVVQISDGAGQAEAYDGAGPAERDILADGLSGLLLVAGRVPDIVGDLIRLADLLTELAPRIGILEPRRRRAANRRRREQRTGLRAVIMREIHLRLAFPGLSRDDAARHADG